MNKKIDVGSIIRFPNWENQKGFRAYFVEGHYLGGLGQESTWGLIPLDQSNNMPIQVPCIILETHPALEIIK